MIETATCPRLMTAGVMATKLRVPLHRVAYVLTTRGHIAPVARAGTLRLYNMQTLALVREELASIRNRYSQEAAHAQ